jgi:hypothetical protein
VKNITARTYSSTDYITVAEIKSQLRITSSSDDTYLGVLLNAVFDAASQIVGYEIRKSTVDYFFNGSDSGVLHIPARILSLTSVKYRDTSATQQTLSSSNYDIITELSANYGYDITLIDEPNLYDHGWRYKVTVVEGFAKSGDTADISKIFPDSLKWALYAMAEDFYTQRGGVVIGASVGKLDIYENLLSQWAIKEFV